MKTIQCRDIHNQLSAPINVDNLSFRPSVYGVIIQDQKILLLPQWDGYDFVVPPV